MELLPHKQVPSDDRWLLVARKLEAVGDEDETAADWIKGVVLQD